MRNILRLVMIARPYWWLLIITGLSLIVITALNLTAPYLVMQLTGILTQLDQSGAMLKIRNLTLILIGVYVGRAVFSYFYSYVSHVAAWHLVADMRVKVYNHLQKLSLKYYHDKQTGQLMSRATNDTATFEVLIAHAVPDLNQYSHSDQCDYNFNYRSSYAGFTDYDSHPASRLQQYLFHEKSASSFPESTEQFGRIKCCSAG